VSQSIYRLDKFVVPTAARDEFLDRVRRTHTFLKEQPGSAGFRPGAILRSR